MTVRGAGHQVGSLGNPIWKTLLFCWAEQMIDRTKIKSSTIDKKSCRTCQQQESVIECQKLRQSSHLLSLKKFTLQHECLKTAASDLLMYCRSRFTGQLRPISCSQISWPTASTTWLLPLLALSPFQTQADRMLERPLVFVYIQSGFLFQAPAFERRWWSWSLFSLAFSYDCPACHMLMAGLISILT